MPKKGKAPKPRKNDNKTAEHGEGERAAQQVPPYFETFDEENDWYKRNNYVFPTKAALDAWIAKVRMNMRIKVEMMMEYWFDIHARESFILFQMYFEMCKSEPSPSPKETYNFPGDIQHNLLNVFAYNNGYGNIYNMIARITAAKLPIIEGFDDCELYNPKDTVNWGWYVSNLDKSWTTWVYKLNKADRQLTIDINVMTPPVYEPAISTLDEMLPYRKFVPGKAKLLSKIQYKECVCGARIQSCFHYCDACYSLADLFPECSKNVEEDKEARSNLTDKQKVLKRIQGRRHMIQTYNIHFRKRAKKLAARRKFVERPKKDLQELNIRFLQYKAEKDMSTCYDFCEAVAVETKTSRGLTVVATEINIDPRSEIETVVPSLLRDQLSKSGFHEMVIDGTAKAVFDRLVADVAWDDIPIIPTHFGVGMLNMIKYLKTKAVKDKEMTKKYAGKNNADAEILKIDHYINALNTMNNVVIAKMSKGARRDKEWDDMRDRLTDYLEFGATKADIIELCKSVKIKMEEYLNDAELKSTNIEKCFVQ